MIRRKREPPGGTEVRRDCGNLIDGEGLRWRNQQEAMGVLTDKND